MNVKTLSFRIKEPTASNYHHYHLLEDDVWSFFGQNMSQVTGPFTVSLFRERYYVSRVYHKGGITAVVGVKTGKNPEGEKRVEDVNVDLASDLSQLDDLSRKVEELYTKRQVEFEVDAKNDK